MSRLTKGLVGLFILGSLVSLFAGAAASGQDATGRIIGNITDPSGAPVVDVNVVVTNTATHLVYQASSDKDGYFQVLSLPIGTYNVTIEHPGFRKRIYEHQTLQIDQS